MMDQVIKQIEAAAGNPVYVGAIPGTSDYPRPWATVRHDGLRVEVMCAGETKEAAVAALFKAVIE